MQLIHLTIKEKNMIFKSLLVGTYKVFSYLSMELNTRKACKFFFLPNESVEIGGIHLNNGLKII